MNSPSNKTLQVVHVDDDLFEIERIKLQLNGVKYGTQFQLMSCQSIPALHDFVKKHKKKIDVFLLDINIENNDQEGIQVARLMRQMFPESVIVMSSNMDDGETIVKAINAGADDFISKTCDDQEIALRIANSYQMATLKRGGSARSENGSKLNPENQVAGSTMRNIAARIPGLVTSAVSAVFVGGESGSGKEVVADLFAAQLGPTTPFIKVNCGAIAQGILESELFGHVKGSFSGALQDKKGYIEAANGGWIFLDEVATLTPSSQVALLRTLENQEVMRVGSTKALPVQFRILSATNENIPELIKTGKFRSDLWQRLRETEIQIPALRDRTEEIPQLVEFFCRSMRGGPYEISPPTVEILTQYDWSEGNVRELRNCLRAMTEFSANKLLTPLSVPKRILQAADTTSDEGDSEIQVNGMSGKIQIEKPEALPFAFGDLEDKLLLETIRLLAEIYSKPLSLRTLAKTITVSRSTLSQRLKTLVQRKVIGVQDLQKMVNISG